ncbi:MAG: NADH-quinone oxidoreductase subunit L [Actinomycetales bacterium]|nr:NADH-quinone oxidoreductase subunit L [Tetrasphaera sp.]NLW98825.1 NADH-quinone oxidoreductase subunit L [Actinomycetales bacterium]
MIEDSVSLHLPIVATILIPFAAALLGLAAARRSIVKDITVIAGFLAVVSAAYRLVTISEPATGSGVPVLTVSSGIPEIALGEVTIPFDLAVGSRTALISLVVAVVTLAVLAFATWYLAEDDRLGVFLATVSLFAAAMQLVVHSGDLVLTLVGWEVMGYCSYLLIGHWSRSGRARRAAYKSFIVTRLADVGFVLGVVILASGARSTGYTEVVTHWSANTGAALTLAISLLVIAVLGKSAQFPFQDWLADAMAGPTPASALIHAATMVAAGTVVLAQLRLLLALAPAAQWLLAVSVAVTMILGAVLAIGQSDLKTLLAWSTVSQVAVMLAPLALVADLEGSAAALFHMYSHALFKALLFLTIGWLSLSIHSTLAARLQGTAGRRLSQAAVVIGFAALAGLPLVVGGWSKELVVATVAGAGAGARGGLLLVALLVTVVLTALYATRAALILVRPGQQKADEDLTTGELRAVVATRAALKEAQHKLDAAPFTPRAVIVLLTVATAFGGIVLLAFEDLLGVPAHVSVLWLTVTLVLALAGIALAWVLSKDGDLALRLGSRQPLWDQGFQADRAYLALVATPVLAAARAVRALDTQVVDAPVRALARQAVRLSDRAGDAQTSRPLTAAALVGIGLVVLLALGVVITLGGGA